jgi:tyrosyl-tRNA synthetase
MSLIEELRWRGMIQDIMPGTEEQLNKEITSAYIGFDPTADSLHIGSLVPILLLVHLQKAGHKPIALVGGATGMVGDPSGKSEERNLLSEEVLQHNQQGVKKQLEKFLDFDCGARSAEIVNNYDWFRNMSFLEFIRDVGKHITVNYMMAKESVKKRIEGDGMSFTEFTYQLVQGYDFYWLYANKNCKLQMGGSDQWGNIVTGTELIRRKNGGEAFAFTCPLITKADGGKFGKTEKGNIWLDPQKTSPYQFYQFWRNASDGDVEKWIRIFTFLTLDEIEHLSNEHAKDPGQCILQKKLAEEVTSFVHGVSEYQKVKRASEFLFGFERDGSFLRSIDETLFLTIFESVPSFYIDKNKVNTGINVVDFLVETKILPSKGETRKLIQNGGLSINKWKVPDTEYSINYSDLIHEKYITVQKGKKNYYLVKAV